MNSRHNQSEEVKQYSPASRKSEARWIPFFVKNSRSHCSHPTKSPSQRACFDQDPSALLPWLLIKLLGSEKSKESFAFACRQRQLTLHTGSGSLYWSSHRYTTIPNSIRTRVDKINAELVTLTYGSMVAQLCQDFNGNYEEVNKQLDKMGHNIGMRLIEDFFARSGSQRCANFRETAETISKVCAPCPVCG